MIRKGSLVGSQAERPAVYVLPHGYTWKVTRDPAGCYRGRFFRYCDLRDSAEDGTWPEGIVFEHRKSGQRLTFRHGALRKA